MQHPLRVGGLIAVVLLVGGCGGGYAKTKAGVITTVAGGGVQTGKDGDGGKATSAFLSEPADVAFDSHASMYIVEAGLHVMPGARVRKVDDKGVITTFAGIAVHGFSGDGGPAAAAKLALPISIAFDADDNLYISDTGNDRIRKVDSKGVITTAVKLKSPGGITIDKVGNIYACSEGTRVVKIARDGTQTTVAGNGDLGFSGDGGAATAAKLSGNSCDVALDGDGNLYIADQGNQRIRKVDGKGVITTIAGTGEIGEGGDGGPATKATFYDPTTLAVDGDGNVYVSDHHNDRLRKIDKAGTITTFIGTGDQGFSGDGGLAKLAELNQAWGPTVFEGELYLADTFNGRIRKVGL